MPYVPSLMRQILHLRTIQSSLEGSRYISTVLLFFKKHPEYLSETNFDHGYNTRQKNNFQIEKHNTTSYEKGLLYSGQIFYNKLPNELQIEINVNTFKNKIKLLLMTNDVYSVTEFLNLK